MNRSRCFLIVVIVTLLLTSCDRVNTVEIIGKTGINTDVSMGNQTENDKINNNNQKNYDSPEEINYKIIDERYIDKEIIIVYPQITNLGDDNKQKSINDVLKTEALTVLGFYENSNDVLLEINYNITWQSKNIFSVQYSGIANAKDATYPLRLFYTSNINITSGSKLCLKDFVKIDENFVNSFRNYKVKNPEINQASARAFDYIINTYSVEDLIRYFESADSSYENSAFTFSYFTKHFFGISIEVPHAVGDHMEIELRYEDITDNIKTETEIWNDFLNL